MTMRDSSGLSLRHKLPLFVSGITAAALIIAGTLAYFAVRASNRDAVEARLAATSAQLAGILNETLEARRALETRVAESEPVHQVLRGDSVPPGELAVLLDSLRTDSDRGLPVRIVGPAGEVVFQIGSLPPGTDPDPSAPLASSPIYGPFRAFGDWALYWVSLPVLASDGTPLGWITQRRRIGTPGIGEIVEALIGNGAVVRIGQAGDPVWIDPAGGIHKSVPTDLPLSRSITYATMDGAESLGIAAPLAGTPWLLVLDMPMALVTERSQQFLRRMLLGGSVLVLLVIVVAWRSSTRLVVPLIELADAADGMAAGYYRTRVSAEGDDEVGRLARAFNTMAERVQRSQKALESRLGEANQLAFDLETAHLTAKQALREAESENQNKSAFLATLSHELRNPLAAVMSYVELLQMGVPDSPTPGQLEYLERIELASQMLGGLVNDILEYSHIESGQLRVNEEIGRAADAIELGIVAIEPRARRKDIRIESFYPADASYVGDCTRVQQIVLNLVSNAVKFTPNGGRVTLRCASVPSGPPGIVPDDSPGPWLRLDVIDSGIGIAKEDLERVFDPFVQGEAVDTWDARGAGLGLAISRRLASLMSGAITVESEPGLGSRFTLWLRAAQSNAVAA
jgi:signal transduction histidine kinase